MIRLSLILLLCAAQAGAWTRVYIAWDHHPNAAAEGVTNYNIEITEPGGASESLDLGFVTNCTMRISGAAPRTNDFLPSFATTLPGPLYTINLRAQNAWGLSDPASLSLTNRPGPPQNLRIIQTDNTLTVSIGWTNLPARYVVYNSKDLNHWEPVSYTEIFRPDLLGDHFYWRLKPKRRGFYSWKSY